MKGNVTRRGRNSWRLKFDRGRDADGERLITYMTVRGSKREAYAKLAEQLAAVGKGEFVEPSKLMVADHVRTRIAVWHTAGDIGDATRERYNVLLKRQISPHIGATTIQKLTTDDVEKWHVTLRATGLAPRTVRHAHRLLGKALGDAVRHNQLSRNVCGIEGQRAPKVPKKNPAIVKKDQIGEVVAKLQGSDIFPKAMLALFCGLRAGEVLALKWSAIDLEGRVLEVRESVEEVAGQPLTIKRPKTEAGIRKLTLPDVVADALRDRRRQQLEQRMARGLGKMDVDTLVFPTLSGEPSRRTALSIQWGEAAEAIGIPAVTFHGLRHSHASMLIAAKVDIVTIAARLGHANAAVTLRIYAHEFEESDVSAADAINLALGASSVPKKG